MAKAIRPIFIPTFNGPPYVQELEIEFEWFSGFALVQAQKSIASLHRAGEAKGIKPILEISTKSPEAIGVVLSAFNLSINTPENKRISVESAFQGSKIFESGGGPYIDLYSASSRDAKTDERLRNSGDVIGFKFFGEDFPAQPLTAFYDWLYISGLWHNRENAEKLMIYKGFSDIAFNPAKSINCQARSAALFVALNHLGFLEKAIGDRQYFLNLLTSERITSPTVKPKQLRLFE